MSPPMVYEETKPRSQRTIRINAMVQSIFLLLIVVFAWRIENLAGHCRQTQVGRYPWTRRPGVDSPSLESHVILDRLHPLDLTCNLDCLVDVGLGIDETAQLNDTLEGFDVDLS